MGRNCCNKRKLVDPRIPVNWLLEYKAPERRRNPCCMTHQANILKHRRVWCVTNMLGTCLRHVRVLRAS